MREIELSADLQAWLQVGWFETAMQRGIRRSGWRGHPMQTDLTRAFKHWRELVEGFLRVVSKTAVTWSHQSNNVLPFRQELADQLEMVVEHQCRVYVAHESYDEW